MSEDPAAKPAILQESTFTLHEGFAYRLLRTAAIWMNKLFFSSLALLAVWLVAAAVQGETGCAADVPVPAGDGSVADAGAADHCSVFLTPTAKYLAAMAAFSFALSILLGLGGLVVGKQVLRAAKAEEEVGARRPPGAQGQ